MSEKQAVRPCFFGQPDAFRAFFAITRINTWIRRKIEAPFFGGRKTFGSVALDAHEQVEFSRERRERSRYWRPSAARLSPHAFHAAGIAVFDDETGCRW